VVEGTSIENADDQVLVWLDGAWQLKDEN